MLMNVLVNIHRRISYAPRLAFGGQAVDLKRVDVDRPQPAPPTTCWSAEGWHRETYDAILGGRSNWETKRWIRIELKANRASR